MTPSYAGPRAGAGERFRVDLEGLDDLVDRMIRCEDDLDALLAELTARVRALHGTWQGAAAAAQLDAQRRWEAGFRSMHTGLARMRAAGRDAHRHYTGAVTTNTGMWDQLA